MVVSEFQSRGPGFETRWSALLCPSARHNYFFKSQLIHRAQNYNLPLKLKKALAKVTKAPRISEKLKSTAYIYSLSLVENLTRRSHLTSKLIYTQCVFRQRNGFGVFMTFTTSYLEPCFILTSRLDHVISSDTMFFFFFFFFFIEL